MTADIQISAEALAKMIKFDISIKGKETAGLLIGEEKDNIVYIDDVRIGEQEANAVHVQITTEELVMAAIEVSERTDGKSIVGWIHTHPGMSAFLSSTDINTQLIYQAQMPNSVAIVIDANTYKETGLLEDLDLGVFRVINNKAVRQNYSIRTTADFAIKSYVFSKSNPITTKIVTKEVINDAYAPVLDKNRLAILKSNVDKLRKDMDAEDASAIQAWIELTEALQSGDIMKVPIDVVNLQEKLLMSIDQLDEAVENIEFELEDQRAQKSMWIILVGIFIEILIFYLFLS
ncbi:MAG: Mov34/MPN/PAD-1 family protein [Candidatus Heimdallarchaeota archaeon]|nr:Mov34/MPN/PAD-1 family protein [Candidatus Heimdallarchaeota archaeon]